MNINTGVIDSNQIDIQRREEALAFMATNVYREMKESLSQFEKEAIERLIVAQSDVDEMQARTNIAAARMFLNWMKLIIDQGHNAEMAIRNNIDNGYEPFTDTEIQETHDNEI